MGGEHPDWLPVGWKVSVKVRSCGKKDKYYVNPSSGLKFNSKPEVLRYVESSGKDQKPKELNKVNANSKPEVLRYVKSSEKDQKPKELNKVDIEKTVEQKLPPGWIKKIRTKKKGGKTRRDPYYIDPVSGRHFRSMPEVFRYLESEDSKKLKSKPDDKGRISVDIRYHSQPSSAEAKGQRPIEKKTNKIITGHGGVKSGSKVAAVNKVDIPVVEQKQRNESVAGNLPDKLSPVNGKEQNNRGRRQSRRLADSKEEDKVTEESPLQSVSGGSEVADEKSTNIHENNDLEQRGKGNNSVEFVQQHENIVPQNKRKNSNIKWTNDVPRRASKRLARVEVDPSPELKPSNECGPSDKPQIDTAGNGSFNDSNDDASKYKTGNPTNSKLEKPITRANLSPEEHKSGVIDWNEDEKHKKHLDPSLNDLLMDPCIEEHKGGVIDRNEDEKHKKHLDSSLNDPLMDPCIEEHKGGVIDFNEDEKHKKHLDSSLNDLLMDPCIEFAIKTLTGAIPIEDVNKVGESPVSSSLTSPNQTSASSSTLPLGNIWADPCFDFAVKMLTGEVPIEDGSKFQISLQQPLSSSGASGCNSSISTEFKLDNVYPSNLSAGQFDDVNKPVMKRQQCVRDPPFPHAINGSSQEL